MNVDSRKGPKLSHGPKVFEACSPVAGPGVAPIWQASDWLVKLWVSDLVLLIITCILRTVSSAMFWRRTQK